MADFLDDYLFHCKGNEVPVIFHKWAGLVALSACAGRRFWLPRGGVYTVYPNIYVLLVGEPGTKKSTAMDIALSYIDAVGDIPVCADRISKEALAKELSASDSPARKTFIDPVTKEKVEYNITVIFADEWSNFIGIDPVGMIEFFTTVYGRGKYEVKTKNKGNDVILGPCFPLIGGMTPSVTDGLFKQNIISGGFTRRAFMVFSHPSKKAVAHPYIADDQEEAWLRCIARGKEIATTLCGPFDWTKEAFKWFDDWYTKHKKTSIAETKHYRQSWSNSKHDQALKLAMLLQLGQSDERLITVPNLERALDLIAEVEVTLDTVFEGAGRNEQSSIANKILMLLKTQGFIPKKKLFRDLYADATRQELVEILTHLSETDQVKLVQSQKLKQTVYCSPEYYERKLKDGEA